MLAGCASEDDGRMQVYQMTTAGRLGTELFRHDVSPTWTELASLDLNGDGNDETGFYRTSDGTFNIYQMTSTGSLGERISSLDLYP